MDGVPGAFLRRSLRRRGSDCLSSGPLSSCWMASPLAPVSTFCFCVPPLLSLSEESLWKSRMSLPNTRPLRKMLGNQMSFVFWMWEMRLDMSFKERALLSLSAAWAFAMSCSNFVNSSQDPPKGKCHPYGRQEGPRNGSYEAFMTNHMKLPR